MSSSRQANVYPSNLECHSLCAMSSILLSLTDAKNRVSEIAPPLFRHGQPSTNSAQTFRYARLSDTMGLSTVS
eukprot:6467507-Amphidinium_carterae.1